MCGLITLIFITQSLLVPSRSASNYCKVFKQQKAILNRASGGVTNSTLTFGGAGSTPEALVNAYTKLERVAPKGIDPDLKTLVRVTKQISAGGSGLDGIEADQNVQVWTNKNCQ